MKAEILIKGLEMPTDDVLRLEIYPDGQVCRIIGWALSEKRDAKAIALPPHGKLKDTDDVMNRLALKPCYDATSTLLSVQAAIDESETVLEASR